MTPAKTETTPDLSQIAEGLRPLAVPIDSLRPMAGNPHHADLDALMRSWAKFGQRRPLVARRDAGQETGEVFAGNHGLEVARRLGWTHIAVLWTDDDDATAKAWAVADNHTAALGHDDPKLLADLLMSVRGADADLFASTSYSTAELISLLGDVEGEKPATSDKPSPDDAGDGQQSIPESWAVVVECTDENMQVQLLDRLVAEGYQCRALIS